MHAIFGQTDMFSVTGKTREMCFQNHTDEVVDFSIDGVHTAQSKEVKWHIVDRSDGMSL